MDDLVSRQECVLYMMVYRKKVFARRLTMNAGSMLLLSLVGCLCHASAGPGTPDWENERVIAINKEPARATGLSFPDVQSAIRAYSLRTATDVLKK